MQTHSLSKSYGKDATEVQALIDIAINIEKGEFVAIMGASGSGKSTLLHLLGCLDDPKSGQLSIDGKRVDGLNDKQLTLLRRKKIGFIFQFFNLISVLTARENIGLPLEIDGINKQEIKGRVDEMLKLVNLADRQNHYPDELSGGQQQRVAIARALITKPAIILADEPTGNLDSVTSEEVMKLIRNSCDEFKQTIILVTHDPKDAAYADRIIFLKDGRVVDESRIDGKVNQQHIIDKLQEIAE